MKDKLLEATQKFARSIIQPVMFLSITGLVLALSVILKLQFMPGAMQKCGNFLYNIMMNGNINQLSVIFCVGLSVAFAKRKKADAAILGLIVFLLFIYANNAWLTLTGSLVKPTAIGFAGTGQTMTLGVQTIDMGVFLGIILGCITGYVFNKFCDVEFPDIIRIFGGSRLVYLIMIPVDIVLAIVLSYVWPFVNSLISSMAGFMSRTGVFGVFIYGFLNRILIPTGLHHLVYMPFLLSPLGGTATIGGKTVSGAMPIWMAQLGNISNIKTLDNSVRFMTFGFSKVFGCIGIALAFIKTAKPENKKVIKGVIAIGVWYSIFTFLILKLNLKTPGREDATEGVSLASRDINVARAQAQRSKEKENKGSSLGDVKDIVEGLGGPENIDTVNNCFTRLRIEVKDMSLVNDDAINKFKNSGIVKKGKNVQIIIGMKVQTVCEDMKQYLHIE